MRKVQIYAQYCDDIIQHAGAPKHTVVGIHAGSIIVDKFPAQIPKLGVNVTMFLPMNDERIFNEKFTLEIVKNSEVIISAELDPINKQELIESNSNILRNDDDEITGNLQNIISPLQVDKQTVIFVQIKFSNETIKSNSLRIISIN